MWWWLLNGLGVECGVSLEALLDASALISGFLEQNRRPRGWRRAHWPSGEVNSDGMSWGRTSRRIPFAGGLNQLYRGCAGMTKRKWLQIFPLQSHEQL